MEKNSKLSDINNIASYIGISRRTIYRLLSNRQIPALKLGGKWLFDQDIVKQWLSQQMIKNCANEKQLKNVKGSQDHT